MLAGGFGRVVVVDPIIAEIGFGISVSLGRDKPVDPRGETRRTQAFAVKLGGRSCYPIEVCFVDAGMPSSWVSVSGVGGP
jgi:hypothetical protein